MQSPTNKVLSTLTLSLMTACQTTPPKSPEPVAEPEPDLSNVVHQAEVKKDVIDLSPLEREQVFRLAESAYKLTRPFLTERVSDLLVPTPDHFAVIDLSNLAARARYGNDIYVWHLSSALSEAKLAILKFTLLSRMVDNLAREEGSRRIERPLDESLLEIGEKMSDDHIKFLSSDDLKNAFEAAKESIPKVERILDKAALKRG